MCCARWEESRSKGQNHGKVHVAKRYLNVFLMTRRQSGKNTFWHLAFIKLAETEEKSNECCSTFGRFLKSHCAAGSGGAHYSEHMQFFSFVAVSEHVWYKLRETMHPLKSLLSYNPRQVSSIVKFKYVDFLCDFRWNLTRKLNIVFAKG